MQFLKFIVIFMAVLIVAGLAIIGFTIFNNITSPGSSDKNHESNYHFQTCKYIGKINSFNEQEVVVCTSSGNSSLFQLYEDGWKLINVNPVGSEDVSAKAWLEEGEGFLQFFLEKKSKN